MKQEDPFRALADPTRRAIMDRLRDGPCNVSDLTEALPISQSAVSQQLGVLRAAGLVSQKKDGTRRIYSVDGEGFASVRHWVGTYETFWDDGLDRLRTHLAKGRN
ncbi:ArsR/SmtB family transcription factor [Gymnodinialimonas hymeniacidonis]|uniref:ArsR/SmtB family transcription factor n=1 Tax=Gymnodinialimonas hymeniacidonis TaxID=3126508 RepID=UPI0034C69AE5